MNNVSALADYELDAAFAASFDLKDQVAAQYYGDEIRTRLQSFASFATGATGDVLGSLFGASDYFVRFPKYEARAGQYFSQTSAGGDILNNAAKLPKTAAELAGDAANKATIGMKYIGLGLLAIGAVWAVTR